MTIKIKGFVMVLTLDRPEKGNAIHSQTLNGATFAFQHAHDADKIWAIVLRVNGETFCVGEDLYVMRGKISPHNSSIPETSEAILLAEILMQHFKSIVSKVVENVYARGYIFLACSTGVIAADPLQFGLPKVKRELFPMQLMEALLRVIPARLALNRSICGYKVNPYKALKRGLISEVALENQFDEAAEQCVENILKNSPTAIRLGM